MDQKSKLRTYFQSTFPKDLKERQVLSARVCRHLQESKEFKKARVVALYSARLAEVDLSALWELRPDSCAFPRVESGMKQLVFYRVSSLSDLKSGFGDICEPPPLTSMKIAGWGNTDLVLVPGVAFDSFGGRLGSGAGYYDRFLGQLPVGISKWGICWHSQISLERLVQDRYDILMDAICTERGIVATGGLA